MPRERSFAWVPLKRVVIQACLVSTATATGSNLPFETFKRKQRSIVGFIWSQAKRPCVWCVVSREYPFAQRALGWFAREETLKHLQRRVEFDLSSFQNQKSLEPPKSQAHQTAPLDLRAVSGSWQARRPNSFLVRFRRGSVRAKGEATPFWGGPAL